MKRMDIRRATAADIESLAYIDSEAWRAAYAGLMPDAYLDRMTAGAMAAHWMASLEREAAKRRQTLVADDGWVVPGYATVGPDTDSDDGLLYLMYVLPQKWGQGVGRALMDASIAALRDAGHRRAALWVLQANSRARRFYEAGGWWYDGRRQHNDYGGLELRAVRMTLDVDR
jgi:GNAT superfamily N-acetyltransferase